MRSLKTAAVLLAGLLLVTACSEFDGGEIGTSGFAELVGPDGSHMGTVHLEQGPNGVLISVAVSGLTEGAHGFHIHSVGACTPDFGAAGDHFAPSGHGHGFLHADGPHAGDLPNIYAAGDGTAQADFFTDQVTLADYGKASLFDNDGSAFIVHAKPDTYSSEAGAGDRVACGVIVTTR